MRVIVKRPIIQQQSNAYLYGIYHCFSDLLRLLPLIQKRMPALLPHYIIALESRVLYNTNMFICSWELFNELCNVWFPILADFERSVAAERFQSSLSGAGM